MGKIADFNVDIDLIRKELGARRIACLAYVDNKGLLNIYIDATEQERKAIACGALDISKDDLGIYGKEDKV
jgi:hypothetical protein